MTQTGWQAMVEVPLAVYAAPKMARKTKIDPSSLSDACLPETGQVSFLLFSTCAFAVYVFLNL